MGIDINKILADHMLWLLGGDGVARADLSGANLRGANLRYADLSRADLSRADLSGATGVICLPLHDPRGYRPLAIAHLNGWMVASGCRWLTQEQARLHWGSDYGGERAIGDLYLAALDWLDAQPQPAMD